MGPVCFSQCISGIDGFQSGEKLSYDAYYNWGFIWIKVGEAIFEVRDSVRNDHQLLHFRGYGGSYPNYDWIFKVREDFNVTWDPATLKALDFKRTSTEGKFQLQNKYWYDFELLKLYTDVVSTERSPTLDTLDINECSMDVLTAIYFARTLDYSKYIPDEKIPVSVIIDNEVFDLYFRYVGREVLELKSGRSFNTIVFKPYLVKGTIFDGGEDMTVWVTDDQNKIPVMVQANILVGSVKAVIRDVRGNKHTIEAEVFERSEN